MTILDFSLDRLDVADKRTRAAAINSSLVPDQEPKQINTGEKLTPILLGLRAPKTLWG